MLIGCQTWLTWGCTIAHQDLRKVPPWLQHPAELDSFAYFPVFHHLITSSIRLISLWWCVDPWDEQQTTEPSTRVGEPSVATCSGAHKHSLSMLTLFITRGLGRDCWHCEMLAWAWEAATVLSPWVFLVPFAQIKSLSWEMQMTKINGFLAALVFWGPPGFICGVAGVAQGILGWSGCHSAVSEFYSAFTLSVLGLVYGCSVVSNFATP